MRILFKYNMISKIFSVALLYIFIISIGSCNNVESFKNVIVYYTVTNEENPELGLEATFITIDELVQKNSEFSKMSNLENCHLSKTTFGDTSQENLYIDCNNGGPNNFRLPTDNDDYQFIQLVLEFIPTGGYGIVNYEEELLEIKNNNYTLK